MMTRYSVLFVGFVLLLLSCFLAWVIDRSVSSGEEETRMLWDGASLVKICTSGTRIFQLKDGRYITKDNRQDVIKDPTTVCN